MPSLPSSIPLFHHLNITLAGLPHRPLEGLETSFFVSALSIAHGSNHPKARVGAVLVQKGRIIASGVNQYKTHPKAAIWKALSQTLCAEMDALLEAQRDASFVPKKTVCYVGRLGRDGHPRVSYLCPGCMAAMLHVGVNKFVCAGIDGKPAYMELIDD